MNVTPEQIEAEVVRALGKGIKAGVIFIAVRAKELVTEPAPRTRVQSRKGFWYWEADEDDPITVTKKRGPAGSYYYRATTPATAGAPPRKLSGRGRAGITWEVNDDGTVGRAGTNIPYMARWERSGLHMYLQTTLDRYAGEVGRIIGTEAAG